MYLIGYPYTISCVSLTQFRILPVMLVYSGFSVSHSNDYCKLISNMFQGLLINVPLWRPTN